MNIGIVGCGYWGPNLVRNFNELKEVKRIVCCDKNKERLEGIKHKYRHIEIVDDYLSILDDDEIDAVVIATPVRTHYELAKKALLKDKHVLVEKPITDSSKEAEELIKIAKDRNKILMVDHTFEYSAEVNKIKELVEKGELGKILTVTMNRLNLGLFQSDINVITDLIPHDVSILLYILKKMPVSARAIGESYVTEGIVDHAHVTLRFPGKIMANLHLSWLDPCKIRRTTIVGDKKMLVYDDVSTDTKIQLYDKGISIDRKEIHKENVYDTFAEFQASYRFGDVTSPRVNAVEPLKTVCSHFIDCINHNKVPQSDGVVGLNVVKVLEAAQESLRNNGKEIFF